MIKTFSEYMNEKGTVVKDPPVEKTPDYEGTTPAKPEQGKGSAPYVAPSKGSSDKYKVKVEKGGFSEKGSIPEYKPDTKVPAKVGEGGKKLASYPNVGNAPPPKKGKLRTEEFLDATKGMTFEEFTDFMSHTTKAGDASAAHPAQYIKYVTSMMKENANVATALIMEAKRLGILDLLVYESMQHQEGIATVVEMMGDQDIGPAFCRRMSRIMNEEIAPPMFDDGAKGSGGSEIPTDPQDAGENAPKPGSEGDPTDFNNPPVDVADDSSPGDAPMAPKPFGIHREQDYDPSREYEPEEPDDHGHDDPAKEQEKIEMGAHENMIRAMSGHKAILESMAKKVGQLARK